MGIVQRVAAISDEEGNIHALDAVLGDIDKEFGLRNVSLISCGDPIGYCAFPRQTLEKLLKLDVSFPSSDHTLFMINQLLDDPKPDAKTALEWTKQELGGRFDEIFSSLKPVYRDSKGYVSSVHTTTAPDGNGFIPQSRYVNHRDDAVVALCNQPTTVTLYGHTHKASFGKCFVEIERESKIPHDFDFTIFENNGIPLPSYPYTRDFNASQVPAHEGANLYIPRVFVGVGSVGQPRDGDPRASYAVITLYDDGKIEVQYRKVQYNVALTQQEMRNVNLKLTAKGKSIAFTESIINRLSEGK